MRELYNKLKSIRGIPEIYLIDDSIQFKNYFLGPAKNAFFLINGEQVIFVITAKGIKDGQGFSEFRKTITKEEATLLYNVALETQAYMRESMKIVQADFDFTTLKNGEKVMMEPEAMKEENAEDQGIQEVDSAPTQPNYTNTVVGKDKVTADFDFTNLKKGQSVTAMPTKKYDWIISLKNNHAFPLKLGDATVAARYLDPTEVKLKVARTQEEIEKEKHIPVSFLRVNLTSN